jgi:hypothetical protein
MSSKKPKHSPRRKPPKTAPKLPEAEPIVEAEAVPAPEPVQGGFLERFSDPEAEEVAREAAAELDDQAESAADCRIHWVWRFAAWINGA